MEYKFSELFKWKSGKPLQLSNEGYPVYGSNGIIGYCSESKFENKIILGRVGAYCGSVEYCKGEFNATDNTLITECDQTKILYQYAYYLLKQYNLNNYAGGSAQPLITQSILKHLKCNILDIRFQEKIINILNNYDQLIENNNKRIKLLEDMTKSLYIEWFVRFRFPGHEKAEFKNEIPKGWSYKKFSDVWEFSRGVSYSTEEIECEEGKNLINLKNIASYGGFRRDGTKLYAGKYKNEQVVKFKDLIMGITDMTQDRRTVGAVALIPNIRGIISADLIKLESEIDNVFSYCLFKYGFYSKLISQFGNGANVIHLKPTSIKNQKILIPDEIIINKFVALIAPTIDEVEKLNSENDLLTKQRDSLLPRLMSGKLSVEGKEVI